MVQVWLLATFNVLVSHLKKLYGEDMPLAKCGFLNVTEMVGALSDTFNVQPSTEDGEKHLTITELKPNDQTGATPYYLLHLSVLATFYLAHYIL